MKKGKQNSLRCPLCGNIFPKENHACQGCPFGKACGLICCPRCHYQFVEESKTLHFLKRILGSEKVEKEAGP